jgi:hypothetical protein
MNVEAIVFVFGVLMAIIGFLIVRTMDGMREDMKDTRIAVVDAAKSVQELNVKIAVVIERTEIHDEEIGRIKIAQNEMNHTLNSLNIIIRER